MKHKVLVLIFLFMIAFTQVMRATDTITVEELRNIEEAGTYFVRIYSEDAQGNQISKVLTITISFARTEFSDDEGIDATDFRVTQEEFHSMTNQDWIQKAHAHAWKKSTGESIPVMFSRLEEVVKGTDYRVYFRTENGLETFAYVQIVNGNDLGSSLEAIYINPEANLTRKYNYQALSILVFLIFLPVVIGFMIYFVLWKRIRTIYLLLVKKR